MGDFGIDDSPESPHIFNMTGHGCHDSPSAGHRRPFTAYAVDERPLGSSKHLRIICVGAGVSGINLVRTLRLNLKDYETVVYDKNDGVGGTWFENRYPGCRCDLPSHCYQYSWRPNKEWTNFFSSADEIEAYLRQVCKEENIMQSIKLSHQVLAARWDEDQARWNVRIRNLRTGEDFDDSADFLINGGGILKYVSVPLSLSNASSTDRCEPVAGSGLTLRGCTTSKENSYIPHLGPRTSTTPTRQWPSLEMDHLAFRFYQSFNQVSHCALL